MPYDRFSGGEERRGYHGNHNGKRPDGGPSGWTGTAQRNYGASRRPTVDPKRRMGEEALPRERENEAPENLLVGRNPIREALRAGRPLEKLLVMKGDLSGAARDIVLLNAGVALYAAGVAPTMKDGIALARTAVDTGAANAKLAQVAAFSQAQAA